SDPISLQEPIFRDDGDAVYIEDQIKDDSVDCDRWLDNVAISAGLSKLSERERKILTLRFFGGKTQTEVAGEIGISQAQVSRLEKSALIHMRKFL
ncbi:MAG: sigma-70 family RNA polymerase sigma factor, partial [Eubacteriales bacterium]|nr:sigma-70 family RNA polymerase sigma factor [Eubacteriales bacterium]